MGAVRQKVGLWVVEVCTAGAGLLRARDCGCDDDCGGLRGVMVRPERTGRDGLVGAAGTSASVGRKRFERASTKAKRFC